MLSPRMKRDIYRILPFGLIWLIFSAVYTLLEKGLLGNLTQYPSTENPYNFSRNIVVTPAFAFVIGLLVGAIEIVYLNKLFTKKSFTSKILLKTIIYLAIITFFLVVLAALANSHELQTSVFKKEVWNNTWLFLSNYAFLSVAVYMASIIIVSQFYAEVSESIGQVVLTNFFTGRYHSPKEEERIYMFLDLKSSTTIAETLGHVKYFEMLKEYYSDLSDPIIDFSGEVYQYVGDEIVVSWNLRTGLKNNSCIQCFFAIKAAIHKKSRKYKESFGLFPEFKAGFHVGRVTIGEIGVIKKEIIFTGDVLNTTARIVGLCNSFAVDILLSGDLLRLLDPGPQYQVKSFGECQLRGREEGVEVFTIALNPTR